MYREVQILNMLKVFRAIYIDNGSISILKCRLKGVILCIITRVSYCALLHIYIPAKLFHDCFYVKNSKCFCFSRIAHASGPRDNFIIKVLFCSVLISNGYMGLRFLNLLSGVLSETNNSHFQYIDPTSSPLSSIPWYSEFFVLYLRDLPYPKVWYLPL